MDRLTGKVAVITGASSGFGQGTALAFAAAGCHLVLTARRETKLQAVGADCEKFGVKAVYYAGDARDERTATAVIKLALTTFGKLDILVNNAGIGRTLSLTDTTMADYDLIMDTNVRSAFAFTKAAVPEMLKRHDGQIILVSSVTGIVGHADETAYTCSKFALRGFGQALLSVCTQPKNSRIVELRLASNNVKY